MVTFMAKVKSTIPQKKLLWLLFGLFWKNLGYLLFQHLVTLKLTLRIEPEVDAIKVALKWSRYSVF